MTITNNHTLVFAPLASVFIYFVLLNLGLEYTPAVTAAITFLTVTLWVTEALPIPATSLIPFALFPMFDVIDYKEAASGLGSHVILLLMGAFMLSKSLEKSGAHERLAGYMVNFVGAHSAQRLVFGFMLASGFLSMWISNTATVLIMLPMALAIMSHVDNQRLKVALLLGIAYSASLAGTGTLIGTPPNVIFAAIYQETTGTEYSFTQWMKTGIPIVVISLPLIALWLTRGVTLENEIKLPQLGKWRTEEKRTLIIFGITALAWIFRTEPFGGWQNLFYIELAGDSTVALLACVVAFATPNGKGGRILDWDTAKEIPWGMLLLFAGGITIAKAFMSSGISTMLGNWLSSFGDLPIFAIILIICLSVTYLTEITSNTATSTLLMPILAVAATSSGYAPEVFMIPAAIAASCAFMLPVATAPNAIAYSTGEFEIKDMMREGAILSFGIAFIVAGVSYFTLV